jgi:hypothetical protein
MRSLFNGMCGRCKRFLPRCADVFLRIECNEVPHVLCAKCRQSLKGYYRVAAHHRASRDGNGFPDQSI